MTLIPQPGVEPSWYASLSPEERAALNKECELVHFDSGTALAKEGQPPERAFLLFEGMVCQYKLLQDGRRQISALLLPGDLSDTLAPGVSACDQSLCTLAPVRAAAFSAGALRRLRAVEPLPVRDRRAAARRGAGRR